MLCWNASIALGGMGDFLMGMVWAIVEVFCPSAMRIDAHTGGGGRVLSAILATLPLIDSSIPALVCFVCHVGESTLKLDILGVLEKTCMHKIAPHIPSKAVTAKIILMGRSFLAS